MKKSLLAAATVFLAAVSNLAAQPADGSGPDPADNPPPPHRHHRPPPLPIVIVLDANGDGVIDAAEIANAPAALKKLDKNGDGRLTPDEYMPPRRGGTNAPPPPPPPEGADTSAPPPDVADAPAPPPPGPDGRRPVPPIVAVLDVNGDGIIDASEIANASASLLKLDKNGDGKLTPDEYRLPPPGRRGPPPDDAGGPGGPPPDGADAPSGPPPGK